MPERILIIMQFHTSSPECLLHFRHRQFITCFETETSNVTEVVQQTKCHSLEVEDRRFSVQCTCEKIKANIKQSTATAPPV
ncbi:hypothetical protein J6590_060048 [Homalodisca vitripennis]|nr:hypothetical protein J6590_060048 [Homalodisca vitripennis]